MYDDQKLFEMLLLEGAQAGLTWESILRKRSGYRQAFHHFDVEKVARMGDQELAHHLNNPDIIRNRLKIFSARTNARVFMTLQKDFGSFASYLWAFVEGAPLVGHWTTEHDIPTRTETSLALSKDLKKRGMSFVGPTIIYAYMQAVGLVNDHITRCFRYPPSSGAATPLAL